MSDPQGWVLIGVFTSIMLGGMTLMTTQFSRIIRAESAGINGRIDGLEARLGTMESRIDRMEDRFDRLRDEMNTRFGELDKEVANLATKFWRSS